MDDSYDLGNGFYKKWVTVENRPGHWEKYAHYEYYYFKGRKLGPLDGFAFSPDKKYAIYSRSEDGKLYVFGLRDETEYFSGIETYCYPSDFDWSTGGLVRLECRAPDDKSYPAEINLKKFSE